MNMKRILLLLLSTVFLYSCAIMDIPPQPHVKSINYMDYSEFTKDGFFITESNSVGFDYTTLGTVYTLYMSGADIEAGSYKLDSKQGIIYDDAYPMAKNNPKRVDNKEKASNKDKDIKMIYYTPKDALKGAYDEAIKRGGNGIINLKMDIVGGAYTVSGMVIKK